MLLQAVTLSMGINDRMLSTDSLVDVLVFQALKFIGRVPTQSVDLVASGNFVPKVFDLNRRLRLTLCP